MALSRSIRRPLRRFTQVDNRRRALVVEAVACLLLARLGLIFVPFPKLARRLGRFVPPNDPRALAAREGSAQARTAEEIGWAVTRSARYVPFKAVCLPQAMAARGEDKPLDAHAWLDAAGVEVTGYPVADKFAEIACFV